VVEVEVVKQVPVSQASLEVLVVEVEKIVGVWVLVEEPVIHLLLVLPKEIMEAQELNLLQLAREQVVAVEPHQLELLRHLRMVEELEVMELQHL
tara:strand:+ start:173 stop:454 length:282 start_codon:yes stop_codon:yes gene_type:complete